MQVIIVLQLKSKFSADWNLGLRWNQKEDEPVKKGQQKLGWSRWYGHIFSGFKARFPDGYMKTEQNSQENLKNL